jgi:hypothetical protein
VFNAVLLTARRGVDDDDEQGNYANQSVAAIIMMVFQYSENPGDFSCLTLLSPFMAVSSVFHTEILILLIGRCVLIL